jgi:16S rRNA (cytosine967-C5)-methyltransferase
MQHPNEFLPSRFHKFSMLILEALESVIESRRYADKELQTILRSHDFEFVEREFVVEVLFDMLRNFRLLQAAAQTREYNHDLFSAWLVLRNYTTGSVKNLQDLKKRITSLSTNRAMRYSYPDWLDAVGVAELGERRWERELSA